MSDVIEKPNLTQNRQMMLDAWQKHTYAEFVLKDSDAALAVMARDPHVLLVPSGKGGTGRAGVHRFYAEEMLPPLPPDLELVPLSQTVDEDRIVEEFVIRFTHTLQMDWVIPDVPATGRKIEFLLVGAIGFRDAKVASEHLYWDQAGVLYQLGIVDHPAAAAGLGSVARVSKPQPKTAAT